MELGKIKITNKDRNMKWERKGRNEGTVANFSSRRQHESVRDAWSPLTDRWFRLNVAINYDFDCRLPHSTWNVKLGHRQRDAT